MAGKKQHILPQFLLAGFASRFDRGEPLIWVHRRDGKIFEPSVEGFGYENYFYGSDQEGLNADPAITALEGPYSKIVNQLRLAPNGADATEANIAEVVAHMSARTKHLRDSFIEASDEILSKAAEYYSDSRVMHAYIHRLYSKYPHLLLEAVDETISKMALSRPQRRLVKRKILGMGKARLIDYIVTANPDIGLDAFQRFTAARAAIPFSARESHIKTLAKDLVVTPRVEEYRKMSWFVVETDHIFILGDVACLFTTQKHHGYKTYGATEDGITGIYMPISSQKLIVGVPPGQKCPQIDAQNFNLGIAKKSRDFFIARLKSDETVALVDELGTDAALLSDEELTAIVTADFADEL